MKQFKVGDRVRFKLSDESEYHTVMTGVIKDSWPSVIGVYIYNIFRDDTRIRGLWRITVTERNQHLITLAMKSSNEMYDAVRYSKESITSDEFLDFLESLSKWTGEIKSPSK